MEFKVKIKSDASTSGDELHWYFGIFVLETISGAYWQLFAGGEWKRVFEEFGGDFPSDTVNRPAVEAEDYYDYESSFHSAGGPLPRFPADGVLK